MLAVARARLFLARPVVNAFAHFCMSLVDLWSLTFVSLVDSWSRVLRPLVALCTLYSLCCFTSLSDSFQPINAFSLLTGVPVGAFVTHRWSSLLQNYLPPVIAFIGTKPEIKIYNV